MIGYGVFFIGKNECEFQQRKVMFGYEIQI